MLIGMTLADWAVAVNVVAFAAGFLIVLRVGRKPRKPWDGEPVDQWPRTAPEPEPTPVQMPDVTERCCDDADIRAHISRACVGFRGGSPRYATTGVALECEACGFKGPEGRSAAGAAVWWNVQVLGLAARQVARDELNADIAARTRPVAETGLEAEAETAGGKPAKACCSVPDIRVKWQIGCRLHMRCKSCGLSVTGEDGWAGPHRMRRQWSNAVDVREGRR